MNWDRYRYYYYHEDDKEEALETIREGVYRLWDRRFYGYKIHDLESQWQFINIMRAKYAFPDYLSLVGEPSGSDFTEGGYLTLDRKAELMLVGAIESTKGRSLHFT